MANDVGTHDQVEAALRKSELRFRTLVGAVSAITWSCPSSGLHVEPQPEWMAFTGQTAEEALGDGWNNALHPEDRAAVASRWREAVARGEPYTGETRIRRHDGEWRWMSVRAAPIREAGGEILEWFGMCVDITEQKKAAGALRASEERFQLFMDNSPAFAWVKDEEGRYVYVSQTYERRFGLEAADWLGKTDAELWPPKVAATFQKNDLAALAAGRPLEIIGETRDPDGSKVHWLVTKFPFRDAEGKRYLGGTRLDITERKRAENALRESEERLRRVSDNAEVGLTRCSRDWIYLSANPAYAEIIGKPLDQIVGRPIAEVMGVKSWETIRPHVERVLRGEHVTYEAELPFSGAGNRYVQIRYTPDSDAEGRIVGWIACITDITERKRAEAALRTSERRFRATFKHQLAYSALLSPEGQLIDASDVALRATGVVLEEIIGLRFLDGPWWRDLPEVRARWQRQFEEALARPGPSRDEVEYRTGDGVLRYALNSVTALRDEQGELEYFLCEGLDITERKRTEDALRDSEERLRLALDASSAGSWAWDAKSSSSTWDERFRMLYDFPPGAPSRFEEWIARLHPEDRARILSRIEELRGASGDDRWHEEFRSVSPEGRVRWHKNLGRAQRDAAGALVEVVGIDLDITERKEAEEALRRSEELNRRTLQALPARIAVLDRNGQILATNQAWDDFAAQNAGSNEPCVALGANYLEACGCAAANDESANLALNGVEDVLKGRRSLFTVEYPCHSPEGQRWCFITVAPLGSDGGAVVTHLDITERRQAQEVLERTRRQLAEGQRIAHVGSWEYDVATRTTIWSDEQKRIFGLEPTAPPPEYAAFLCQNIHPDDAPELDRLLRAALQQRATFENEYRIILPDGSIRWVYEKAHPYFNHRGRLSRYIGATLDITERKLAEAALREADRRKDEFLATLAHELRNPLAPVRNGLEALRKVGAQGSSADRLLATMEGQVDHLVRLVDDLMEISRISRGKFELQKQRIDLAVALAQAVNMSRHLVVEGGLDLRLNLPSKPTPVDGDAVRLTQVFVNLLSNAARHTERGGCIQVTLEGVGDEAVVSVADTGVGISKELLPHIFDPFVQGREKDGQSKQGLGIGLALVREITGMHGGSVKAQSDGEGLGSTFIVRLPLLEAETMEALAPRSAPARLETAPRVLVIDDTPQVAEALAFLLNVLDATVRVAHSGAQGLEICAEFEPELVFLDLSMPKMDGFETARRMRELPAGKRAKLVAVSGFGLAETGARTRDAGFDCHLVKPVRLKQLEELFASVSGGTAQATAADG
jgi:PAS domain S-box-containing protein